MHASNGHCYDLHVQNVSLYLYNTRKAWVLFNPFTTCACFLIGSAGAAATEISIISTEIE